MEELKTDIYRLKIYLTILTAICAVLFLIIFKLATSKNFTEINVERINVIEKDGKLRMVISNKLLQHPGTMDGVTYHERKGQRPPGMLFFSEKGDEVGGLVFDGNTDQGQGGSLTFDKFRSDQTIQLVHEEDPSGNYFSGLKMNDQNLPMNDLIKLQKEIENLPTKEAQELAYKDLREKGLLMTERLRIGKDSNKSSILRMKDAKGKTRIEMLVEASGNPSLKFFDETGKMTSSLPDSQSPSHGRH